MSFKKRVAAVSIVTRSHIPFARVLFDSLRRSYPHMPMFLVLADEPAGDCSCGENVEIIPVSEMNVPELENMLRRYTNTELCVALKPFAITEVLRRSGAELDGALYLDSDLYFISPMEELEREVDAGAGIILTPHLNAPMMNGRTSDLTMLRCGVFNMGFAYFANTPSVRALLDWWGGWLRHFCYEDFSAGLFGDQKWMDLLPCFTDELKVLRHNGYNVAYWNIDQRPLTRSGGVWLAGGEPLRFLHFSVPQLEHPLLFSRNTDRYDAGRLRDLPLLVKEYAGRVHAAGLRDYAGKPNLLRRHDLPRSDVRHVRSDDSGRQRLSGLAKLARGALLAPAACVFLPWRLLGLGLQCAKSAGRWLLGPALLEPEAFMGWLLEQPQAIRALAETPFLLSVYLARRAGNLRQLALAVKERGLPAVKKETAAALGYRSEPIPGSILVTDARVPHHDMIAADLTTFNLLKDLVGFGYTVTFLPGVVPWPERYAADLRRLGVILDYSPERHGSPAEYIRKFGHQYSAFYLQPLWIAADLVPIARKVAPKAKIIFHAADLCFVRERREAELRQDAGLRKAAGRTKRQELGLIRKVDHLVVISDSEKALVAAETGGTTPISSFTCLYAKCQDSPAPFEKRAGVLFIGVFGHRPNVDAVLWFTREVWPLIRRKAPDMAFHVVGNYAPAEILELDGKDGIVIEGHVPDLAPLLSSSRVAVAPLRYGAGIKGKIATAMGAGIPNVCTSIAVEGMGIENGRQALIADAPPAFADAVLRLDADAELWRRLSGAGLGLVREHFSEEAGTRQFERVLKEAGLWRGRGGCNE